MDYDFILFSFAAGVPWPDDMQEKKSFQAVGVHNFWCFSFSVFSFSSILGSENASISDLKSTAGTVSWLTQNSEPQSSQLLGDFSISKFLDPAGHVRFLTRSFIFGARCLIWWIQLPVFCCFWALEAKNSSNSWCIQSCHVRRRANSLVYH